MTTQIIEGDSRDVLRTLPGKSVQMCVTSPPYFGLRDYGHAGQMGLESTPAEYVENMVDVFGEVRRVLKDDGTLWLNIGDSYAAQRGGTHMPAQTVAGGIGGKGEADTFRGTGGDSAKHAHRNAAAIGLKHKDLIGIPWLLAFALRADGWYLRQDIIWHKPNPMPESVQDRCTKAHEYIFLLSKSDRYYFDAAAIAEPVQSDRAPSRKAKHTGAGRAGVRTSGSSYDGTEENRNRRSVWTVPTKPYSGAHFATFPPDLIEPCIAAGSAPGDTVIDPFGGAGTTGLVCDRMGRNSILIELNPTYADIARKRVFDDSPLFAELLTNPTP